MQMAVHALEAFSICSGVNSGLLLKGSTWRGKVRDIDGQQTAMQTDREKDRVNPPLSVVGPVSRIRGRRPVHIR